MQVRWNGHLIRRMHEECDIQGNGIKGGKTQRKKQIDIEGSIRTSFQEDGVDLFIKEEKPMYCFYCIVFMGWSLLPNAL